MTIPIPMCLVFFPKYTISNRACNAIQYGVYHPDLHHTHP